MNFRPSQSPILSSEEEMTLLQDCISHELRTPLTSIQGALGLLLSGKINADAPQAQQLLRIASNNANRLLRLTNAIERDKETMVSLISAANLARFRLEYDLHYAWQQKNLEVFYQPIVTVEKTSAYTHSDSNSYSSKITGFEALLRWHHPVHGWVSPTEFIPIAEETGLIHELGLWVIEIACQTLCDWQQRYDSPLTISVNLSAMQLLQGDFSYKVQQLFETYPIAPRSLRMEITESLLLENSSFALNTLKQLKNLGILLYLDDFGTGYSSLSRLNELMVDVLKIDRSFVVQKQWEMIRGIIQLAMSLNLDIIAEGIETQEELNQVNALGCQQIQGYWFSAPVNSENAHALLQKQFIC